MGAHSPKKLPLATKISSSHIYNSLKCQAGQHQLLSPHSALRIAKLPVTQTGEISRAVSMSGRQVLYVRHNLDRKFGLTCGDTVVRVAGKSVQTESDMRSAIKNELAKHPSTRTLIVEVFADDRVSDCVV